MVDWTLLKSFAKPFLDLFIAARRDKKKRDNELSVFYLELEDLKNLALNGLRALVSEHNRVNDYREKSARRPEDHGPLRSPQSINVYRLEHIFSERYECFSMQQREAIRELFQFTKEYNDEISAIRLDKVQRYSELKKDFAMTGIVTAATLVFIAAKLCELRERYFIDESLTAAGAINTVLSSYSLTVHNRVFDEPE